MRTIPDELTTATNELIREGSCRKSSNEEKQGSHVSQWSPGVPLGMSLPREILWSTISVSRELYKHLHFSFMPFCAPYPREKSPEIRPATSLLYMDAVSMTHYDVNFLIIEEARVHRGWYHSPNPQDLKLPIYLFLLPTCPTYHGFLKLKQYQPFTIISGFYDFSYTRHSSTPISIHHTMGIVFIPAHTLH